jgi:hypothetical protein
MTYLSGNKTYPVIIPCSVFDNFELSPTIYVISDAFAVGFFFVDTPAEVC